MTETFFSDDGWDSVDHLEEIVCAESTTDHLEQPGKDLWTAVDQGGSDELMGISVTLRDCHFN